MGVKRVLLVEDEADIAEILALVLEGAGYAVDYRRHSGASSTTA